MSKKKRCLICGKLMDVKGRPLSRDFGGDCVLCMARAGDPDCVRSVIAIAFRRNKRTWYFSNLAGKYELDLEDVVTACEKLMNEGKIKVVIR